MCSSRAGSGFVASHGSDFLKANNAQWIGFSMEIGPAGNLFVLDWHDADICGKDVLNKDTGRIFRIAPKQSQAVDVARSLCRPQQVLPDGASRRSCRRSKSAWHARRARVDPAGAGS